MVEFMSQFELNRIEESIKKHKEIVELGKSLERLFANRDFKEIILEDYMQKEAIRLVQLKAEPSMQMESSQKSILTQMDSIGTLTQYFQTLRHKVSMAEKAIEIDEATRDEILEEGL